MKLSDFCVIFASNPDCCHAITDPIFGRPLQAEFGIVLGQRFLRGAWTSRAKNYDKPKKHAHQTKISSLARTKTTNFETESGKALLFRVLTPTRDRFAKTCREKRSWSKSLKII